MKIETSKEAIKARMQATIDGAKTESNVNQFKLTICRFILDAAGIVYPPNADDKAKAKVDALRLEVWKQFRATDGGFGSNLSGWNQHNGFRTAKDDIKEFTGTV